MATSGNLQWWITNDLPNATDAQVYQPGADYGGVNITFNTPNWEGTGSSPSILGKLYIKAEVSSSESKPRATSSSIGISFEVWMSLVFTSGSTILGYSWNFTPISSANGWNNTNCNTFEHAATAVSVGDGTISLAHPAETVLVGGRNNSDWILVGWFNMTQAGISQGPGAGPSATSSYGVYAKLTISGSGHNTLPAQTPGVPNSASITAQATARVELKMTTTGDPPPAGAPAGEVTENPFEVTKSWRTYQA